MRLFTLVLAFLTLASPALRADPAAAADPIEQELAALIKLSRKPAPPGATRPELVVAWDKLCQQVGTDGFAIYEKYPSDPRRWRAINLIRQHPYRPRFVQSVGADYETVGDKAVVSDAAAATAWNARVDAAEAAMLAAPDMPADVREYIEVMDLSQNVLSSAYRALKENGTPPDWAKIDAALTGFLARWPDQDAMGPVSFYVLLKKASGVTDEPAVLAAFADSPNASARDYVKKRLRFFELQKHPLELAFTALDGRAVDLTQMRGKVVLIDFWATWCGPCIAEIPNVKKVYDSYHDKGFEVVGVSLDNEKDRQKFTALVAEKGLPWPQRFEGLGWKDPLALEYTINAIPAMFLLDQTGTIVSTDARGPKLEAEVKRLLKL